MSRARGIAALAALVAAVAIAALAPAEAAAAPKWQIEALSDTTVAPGGASHFLVEIENVGNLATSGTFTLTASLPAGLEATGVEYSTDPGAPGHATDCSANTFPSTTLTCTDGEAIAKFSHILYTIPVSADPGLEAGAVETASFSVSGANGGSASTVATTTVAASPPPFGLAALDGATSSAPGGIPSTAAGAHPYDSSLSFELNSSPSPRPIEGPVWPVAPLRDAFAELPPGLLGDPAANGSCSMTELTHTNGPNPAPLCPTSSQVGTTTVRLDAGNAIGLQLGPVAVFQMVPPPGVLARFAYNVLGTIVALDVQVRSGGDYGVTVSSSNVPEAIPILGTTTTLWGVPASTAHRPERACPNSGPPTQGGPNCASDSAEELAFLRNPSPCEGAQALQSSLRVDSWLEPGALGAGGEPDPADPAWSERSYRPHQAPGYPLSPVPSSFPAGYAGPTEWGEEVGLEGCGKEPFAPGISAQPTTEAADSPSGLRFDLTMPQQGLTDPTPGAISESDLKTARVTLPAGMSVNPSSADGRGACSGQQIGLESAPGATPVRFDPGPASCPDAAKIGTLEIESPLLSEPEEPKVPHVLQGSVYLAAQQDNPFGSLLALYLVVEDPQSGLVLKLPGKIVADEQSGQLETVFDENPQLPFAHLHLELFGGPRAPLRTPSACGTYTTTGTLVPWSGGEAVQSQSSFEITQGCGGGFAPKLSAGTQNPIAGQTSPFNLRLTRQDGEAELGGLEMKLPPGLSGYLKGIPYCPDSALAAVSGELGAGSAEIASPSCPAASQVGTVTVGAGAGADPFFTDKGRAYLAGPYKGAPLSLAVLAPAVAGPFDLGSVVVRNALRIDPESAQITAVSDPFPTILHGVPLDLRDVRVELNRPHFTLNPTSCNEMQIASTVASAQGATASPSVRFQVTGCENLAFKPKLAIALHGPTRRAQFPGLTATLRMPEGGEANIARVQVALPHAEFLAQSHLGSSCTRVQYAAGGGGGGGCPKNTVYGRATAYSPLLDAPLSGKVYLRSNGGERELPDLVASLNGQIHVDLVGFIDTDKRTDGIRTTFEGVPDAPVTKFVLKMPAGKKSLLENHQNLCARPLRAIVQMDAQNGKIHDFNPKLGIGCKGRGGHRRASR